ncbi:MAG: acetyl-CoA carboxylase biotin carboxyl carrier protein [Parvularculaceae bacterium]
MNSYKQNAIEAAWIRELATILDETGLTEIEIQKSDIRVRVARGGGSAAIAYAPAIASASEPAPPSIPAKSANAKPAAPSGPPAGAVTSPMVGTIYLAPSPGADPFVKPGDKVSQGQTLMIVEAMKTMNPIAAPKAGMVKEVLVKDAQPVEFGEALIVVQ